MIRIRQIKINIEHNQKDHIINKIAKLLHISKVDIVSYNIVKQSLDARKKDNICYVYELDVQIENEKEVLKKISSKDIFVTPIEKYKFPIHGNKKLKGRPVIVGSGPAGLFCAYLLAENGYHPLIIERGEMIEQRIATVEEFWQTGNLKLNSNVQFGEGGAGTFSDGKLNTLVKDKYFRGKKAFEIFVENGAPTEIMYLNKPHIGTDVLRTVVRNIRNKIISMGGEFRYNTKLTDLKIQDNSIKEIEVNNNEVIPCNVLVLAIGHSARDTFQMLNEHHIKMSAKPFAVGLRVEHSQALINKSQYGVENNPLLPPATYKLTYTTKNNRGVYSFCMCPGGYVVNASSEEKHLVVNGMSNYKRDTKNANSAIVVTVTPKDFGNEPLAGIAYQRELEKLAYTKGRGQIPLQLYKDFKNDRITTNLGTITPSIKGKYTFANLNEILPEYISEAIKEAMTAFDKKINGYANEDTILLGVESRTSSPVRIERNENGLSNILGVYPCGEGSGYAGGITTAAIDGIKTAENIAKEYA